MAFRLFRHCQTKLVSDGKYLVTLPLSQSKQAVGRLVIIIVQKSLEQKQMTHGVIRRQ